MTAIREALQELVELKDLIDSIPETWQVTDIERHKVHGPKYRAYKLRKPAAWAAARTALAQEVPQEPVSHAPDWPHGPDREPAGPVTWIQPRFNAPGYETCDATDYGAFPVYTTPQVNVAAQEPPPRDPQQEVDLLLGRAAAPITTSTVTLTSEDLASMREQGLINDTAAAPSGELPPLPLPTLLRTVMPDDYRYGHIYGYTADQMRAYAKAARGKPLTDEQIDAIFNAHEDAPTLQYRYLVARAIEAARGEK